MNRLFLMQLWCILVLSQASALPYPCIFVSYAYSKSPLNAATYLQIFIHKACYMNVLQWLMILQICEADKS